MSIQNIKKALFMGATLFSFNAHAQIEKGATSLGGSLDIIRNNYGSSLSNTIILTPTYGCFITNKIMIKGKFGIFSQKSDNGIVDKYRFNQFSIVPEARYYFNPESEFKFFAGASLGFRVFKVNNSNNNPSKFTNSEFNQSVYVGFDRFLNKEIAIESTLSFTHSNLSDGFLTYGLTNLSNVGFNIGLNNFVNFKSAETDVEDLVGKGRSIIGGQLSLNTYSGNFYELSAGKPLKIKGNFATLDAEYGLFVTTGLLIGAKTNVVLANSLKQFGIAAYSQYFHTLTRKLKLQAKAELGYSLNSNYHTTRIKGALGVTYFLSQMLALDIDLLSFNKDFNSISYSKSKNFGSNVGLRYFLK